MPPKQPRMRILTKKKRLNDSIIEDELELEPVDESTQDNTESLAEENAEPNLVETDDGRLIIGMKPGLACPICMKAFVSAKGLKKHKESCEKAVTFKDVLEMERQAATVAQPGADFFKYCNPNPENPCYCCGEDVLTAHIGHIKCKLCPKSFKAYEYMDRHLASVHASNDTFACPQCNAKCSTAKVLNEHLLTHSEGKPFSCLKCGKDFTRKYHLERHLNHSNCGDNPKTMRPCEVCGKEFTRLDNLREHLRFHMGQASRKRDYQCPYCPKSFYGSSLLNIHIRTHTGEKPFPCDLCTKSFPSTGALRKHRRSHTGERPYRCDQCSATFAARETLNRHRKTHTGEKPHQCTVCSKRFIQATQLRAHMFHHTGENGFDCEECGMSFNRKARLDEHIRFTHLKEKPLSCDTCSREFIRKEDLVRHQDSHSSVKSFECRECLKRFVSKGSLTIHQKIHNVESPAECPICHNQFLRQDCLRRHIRSKHRQEYVNGEFEIITADLVDANAIEEQLGPKKNPQVLEIDGEVFQITPLEDVQIVQISSNTTTTVKKESGKEIKVLEVVEISPPKKRKSISQSTAKTVLKKTPAKQEKRISEAPASVDKQELLIPLTQEPTGTEPIVPTRHKTPVKSQRVKRKSSSDKTNTSLTSFADIRAKTIKLENQEESIPIFLSDVTLKQKISELLRLLIDEDMLAEFGWPAAPVEKVLSDVIIRCGHKPAIDDEDASGDYATRMRENTKILFSLTMDEDNIKTVLNNHTVDEVIMNVLKNK